MIWILLVIFPVAIGAGVITPSINSLITQNVPQTDVGTALGVSASLVSLANGITPLVGGLIFQFLGGTALFMLGGVVMTVIGLYAFQSLRPQKHLLTSHELS